MKNENSVRSARRLALAVFSVSAAALAMSAAAPDLPEASLDFGGTTYDFAELSAARFAPDADDPFRPASNECRVVLSPHSLLGNDVEAPFGQVTTLGVDVIRGVGVDGNAKGFSFALTLPAGFEFRGATFCDRKSLVVGKSADGATRWEFAVRPGFSFAWSDYNRMTALVGATAKDARGKARLEVFRDGKPLSKPVEFTVRAVEPIAAIRPRRYQNGIYSSGESAMFFGDEAAESVWADLLNAAGVSWIVPDHRNLEAEKKWRAVGVRTVTPSLAICNAYTLPLANARKLAADERFVASPAQGEWQKSFDKAIKAFAFCPLAFLEGRESFRTNVVAELIDNRLEAADGAWSNWEPHMYENRGCDCARCRAAFEKWKADGKETDVHVFRSQVHANLVRELDRLVRRATGGEKSCGFIPGVCWRACTSQRGQRVFSHEFKPEDYQRDVSWFNPWGPYVYWDALKPFGKRGRETLVHWYFAKDVREENERMGARHPKLVSFPHALQSRTWLGQPEHVEMALDAYFFNRWDATILYFFPQGYDARYWRAFARATSRAAACERFVLDGKCADDAVAIDPVAEFPKRHKLVADYPLPAAENVSHLQSASFRLGDSLLVAALNFSDTCAAFFSLRAAGLDGEWELTDSDGVRYLPDANRGTWSGDELAKGVFLMVGAARTKAFFVSRPGASETPAAKSVVSVSRLRDVYLSRRAELARAAAAGDDTAPVPAKPKNVID